MTRVFRFVSGSSPGPPASTFFKNSAPLTIHRGMDFATFTDLWRKGPCNWSAVVFRVTAKGSDLLLWPEELSTDRGITYVHGETIATIEMDEDNLW